MNQCLCRGRASAPHPEGPEFNPSSGIFYLLVMRPVKLGNGTKFGDGLPVILGNKNLVRERSI